MEKKVKSVPLIPPNYVSILQLQERWLKEKELKQKEGERGVKLQVSDGQGKREEESVMKVAEAMEPRVKLKGKSLGGEKEPTCVDKEKLSENGVGGGGDWKKKKKKWAKKKNNRSGSVEGVLKCESLVSPAYIPRENNPVKEEIQRAYSLKGDTAVETQMGDLWISKRVDEEGETREVKGPARLSNGQCYYRNRKPDWSSTRVIRGTGATIWVKKEKNNGAGGGDGV